MTSPSVPAKARAHSSLSITRARRCDYISNERTKHIERRHLKVRELVEDAVINVKYIATHLNVADIFTKPLERKQFQSLRDKLFNI